MARQPDRPPVQLANPADRSLTGLAAIVTGASSGIGAAALRALAGAGAQVIGIDIKPDVEADPAVLGVDVSDPDSVAAGMAQAIARLGRLDVLVNAAGIEIDSTLAEISVAALDRMYAVNVRGPVLVTQAALPHFSDAGRIINLASELAYLGRAGASGYCATKGAILALTRSWARELGPRIRVNAVAPGPTDTPLLNFAAMSPELKRLELANPLGRIGQPDEIAAAIVFLAGPGASFITGQCLSVDGGAAMH
jgi:3-oxoacyl-[acyl-carrier protein] reductase